MCGRTDIVEALIKHGANIHMKTQDRPVHVFEEVRMLFLLAYYLFYLCGFNDAYKLHVYILSGVHN